MDKHLDLDVVDGILSVLVGVGGLAIYVRTLAPSLLLGDSAELQTLAYTLGMTHPTGYPVYILVGKLFTLLPVGNIAYRINLLSAVFGGLTLSLVYLTARLLGGWRIAALAGPLCLGTAGIFWSQAVIAELYTAAAALIAAVVLLLLLWRNTRRRGFLFLAGMLGALSLGVHNTVLLIAPAVLVYLLLTTRKRDDWISATAGVAIGTILALAAYLFLDWLNPPSSYFNTTLRPSWSVWYNSAESIDSTLERLGFLVAARQFRMYMFTAPLKIVGERAMQYLYNLNQDFPTLGIGFILLGFVWLFFRPNKYPKRGWREGILLLLSLVGILGFVLNYGIWDIFVFYIPAYVILAVVASLGAAAIIDGIAGLVRRLPTRFKRWAAWTPGIFGIILLGVLIWSVKPTVIPALRSGKVSFINSRDFSYYPYPVDNPFAPFKRAQYVVGQLEDNAIVFTDWETVYTYTYVAHVEQKRTGLEFHEWSVQDGVTGVADSAIAYIDANIELRPIYFSERPPNIDTRYRFRLTPGGLFQLTKKIYMSRP